MAGPRSDKIFIIRRQLRFALIRPAEGEASCAFGTQPRVVGPPCLRFVFRVILSDQIGTESVCQCLRGKPQRIRNFARRFENDNANTSARMIGSVAPVKRTQPFLPGRAEHFGVVLAIRKIMKLATL